MKPLSIEQLKIARRKSLQNAGELINDAEILFKSKSWARTLFISQIAGEEIGKYLILTSAFVSLVAGDNVNWKKFWQRITSHQEKLQMATYLEDILLGQDFPKKLVEYFEKLKEETKNLERFKQYALYCDFTTESPCCPSDLISKDIALNALKWAKGRYKLFAKIESELKRHSIPNKISKEGIQAFRKKYGIEKIFVRKR
jgi:AbiV family abortive infection protein